jgi:hypothetical protein
MRRKVGPKESSVKRLAKHPRETNESKRSGMRQPRLSQRWPLTGIWVGQGEVINSLLREVIWCMWFCAVDQ